MLNFPVEVQPEFGWDGGSCGGWWWFRTVTGMDVWWSFSFFLSGEGERRDKGELGERKRVFK